MALENTFITVLSGFVISYFTYQKFSRLIGVIGLVCTSLLMMYYGSTLTAEHQFITIAIGFFALIATLIHTAYTFFFDSRP